MDSPADHSGTPADAETQQRPAEGGDQRQPPAESKQPEDPRRRRRRWLVIGGIGAALVVVALIFGVPWIVHRMNVVTTDDAYVNGHVTSVAARVQGQVIRVLVDDNNRVRKGDLIVQLDRQPYAVQVAQKQAAVGTAKAALVNTEAQVRGLLAQIFSQRWQLQRGIEGVRNQLALLRSNVSQLKVEQANLVLAENDYVRGQGLIVHSAISQQQFDQYKAALEVAKNRVAAAQDTIQQTRASQGLPPDRDHPLDVPTHLDQSFSGVRQALGQMVQSLAQLGITPKSYDATPEQVLKQLQSEAQSPQAFERLVSRAPSVLAARAQVRQAEDDLRQAELNLSYCEVFAEIDGAVARRNVNPGDNAQPGQPLMAIRSLTEIWIDANFKETQLADLRIGQRAELYVDMYGKRRQFHGRITGFTAGTGSTLSLLPPQNATGNFVKVVQRLPVRIELTEPNPEDFPLFIGLSVEPEVYFKEPATGPDAGKYLQPYFAPAASTAAAVPKQ
jgi:membrane fusion protein (multidrug efflux system)